MTDDANDSACIKERNCRKELKLADGRRYTVNRESGDSVTYHMHGRKTLAQKIIFFPLPFTYSRQKMSIESDTRHIPSGFGNPT